MQAIIREEEDCNNEINVCHTCLSHFQTAACVLSVGCLRLSKLHISLTSNNLQFVLFAAVVHPILLAQVSCVDVEHLVLRLGLLLLGLIRKKKEKKNYKCSVSHSVFFFLSFSSVFAYYTVPAVSRFPWKIQAAFPAESQLRKPSQPNQFLVLTEYQQNVARVVFPCCGFVL